MYPSATLLLSSTNAVLMQVPHFSRSALDRMPHPGTTNRQDPYAEDDEEPPSEWA